MRRKMNLSTLSLGFFRCIATTTARSRTVSGQTRIAQINFGQKTLNI
jgi:hypothetical protein